MTLYSNMYFWFLHCVTGYECVYKNSVCACVHACVRAHVCECVCVCGGRGGTYIHCGDRYLASGSRLIASEASLLVSSSRIFTIYMCVFQAVHHAVNVSASF